MAELVISLKVLLIAILIASIRLSTENYATNVTLILTNLAR